MPVYTKQYGGLGNRLFQRAAAIGYAMKYGREYTFNAEVPKRGYYLLVREAGHHYQEFTREPAPEPYLTILDGYWQSQKYFTHCREEVLSQFGFNWEPKPGWCSIHVRRGDYLKYPDKHPAVTMDYIIKAIWQIQILTGVNKFMVFSDDLPWCRENFHKLPYQFLYSIGRTDIEDLIEGSCCEHNIISNSTFSWWQAWLNQNPDKVVVSPHNDNWFGPGNAHLDTSDLIPEPWIQIKY